MAVVRYELTFTGMNKWFVIIGLVVLFSNTIYGQGSYPFKYHITNEIKPDTYILTYQEKSSFLKGQPDSILIVLNDTVSEQPRYSAYVVSYPDRKVYVEFYMTDSAKIEYSSEFGIRTDAIKCPFREFYIVKDTSKTHVISQIKIESGHCYYDRRIIYSKIPLRKKMIRAIREYIYNRGPEPPCVKKKTCYVSLPEL